MLLVIMIYDSEGKNIVNYIKNVDMLHLSIGIIICMILTFVQCIVFFVYGILFSIMRH